MTGQLHVTEAATPEEVTSGPRGARRRDIAVGMVVLVAAVAAIVVVGHHLVGRHHHAAAVTRGSTAGQGAIEIRDLLDRRASAVLHHDRAAFMATVDPADPTFRRSQRWMFDNLARLRFASWSYTVSTAAAHGGVDAGAGYHSRTWSPEQFALHYRLAGFDAVPTYRRQYPTFVMRAGHWYLASLTDFAGQGEVSATDLWDYAPVHVVRRGRALVLGSAAELPTMRRVAVTVNRVLPRVDAVWGRQWARRAVVEVPSTQQQMAAIDGDRGDLNQIVALTSSEVSTAAGHPAPAGNRITINPRNWPKVDAVGASIVLTHELTHVATAAATGVQTPTWLSEGFADYVAFRDRGIPARVAASELAAQVRNGGFDGRLPANRAFRGSAGSLAAAYEQGWLACRYLAVRYGQARLVDFYRAVGTAADSPQGAVSTAMGDVLHLTVPQFTAGWRHYVDAQLA